MALGSTNTMPLSTEGPLPDNVISREGKYKVKTQFGEVFL